MSTLTARDQLLHGQHQHQHPQEQQHQHQGHEHDHEIITIDELTIAIKNRMKLDSQTAHNTAEYILNFFGYDSEILDNILQPEDRTVFYLLYDVGILKTDQERILLSTGRDWRIYYWKLDEDIIRGSLDKEYTEDEEESIYDMITTEQWFGREDLKNSAHY